MKKLRAIARAAFLATTATAAATAPTAYADPCGFSLVASNINVVWSQAFNTQPLTLTINKSKNPPCDYFVTFTKGGASDYNRTMFMGAATLPYQLYKESALTNILMDIPDATSANNIISGTFPAGPNASQSKIYYFNIPYAQVVSPTLRKAGTYGDTFLIKVFRGECCSENLEASATVVVTTVVPKSIQLSLIPTGQPFDAGSTSQTLDFGALEQGRTQAVDLRVVTNAGYAVSFSSQNNGMLKITDPSLNSAVPYAITVSSIPQNLSGSATVPVVVTAGSGQSALTGVRFPIAVTIGDAGEKMAGTYRDNITIAVSTTE